MFDKLIQQVKSYEVDEETYQKNKIRHLIGLRTLYREFPHIYFRKRYFFKTFKDSTLKDWEQWNNICKLYDEGNIA